MMIEIASRRMSEILVPSQTAFTVKNDEKRTERHEAFEKMYEKVNSQRFYIFTNFIIFVYLHYTR
jgi:hypothetical protein